MKKIIFNVCLALLVLSCSTSKNDGSKGDGFDRTAMLTHWADNIIIPSYSNYQEKVQILAANTQLFVNAPTEEHLQLVRESWLEGYKAYQYISIYNIGKAEEVYIKECTNIYPTDVSGIEANIQSGSYDLTAISQFTKQGFPALDYLININGLASTDAEIIAFYTTNSKAANYKGYLTALVNRLKTNADLIVADWNGGYRKVFIENNGNSVSSSVNRVTNNFVKNLEKDIRSGKIGIPSGVFSGGVKFPEKVEAFYKNDVSKELLNLSIKASEDFFNGKNFNNNTTGPSLKSYLDFVNAIRDNKYLSDIIIAQFEQVHLINEGLDNSFSNQINSDNVKMLSAFDTLQQLVIYIKLDMMQALNITLDYVDGDGD